MNANTRLINLIHIFLLFTQTLFDLLPAQFVNFNFKVDPSNDFLFPYIFLCNINKKTDLKEMINNCQQLRKSTVKAIVRIQQNFDGVSRKSMFLAVSIFDLFLQKSQDLREVQPINPQLYGIVALLIAWKFQGDSYPSLDSLAKFFDIRILPQTLRLSMFSIQHDILVKIDFYIPHTTAYQSLDSAVDQNQLNSIESRRNVAKSIKIMITAIQLSCQLSQDPSLGAKIHQITKNKNSNDIKAKNIYRKCIKAIQDERVNQQLKTVIAH